MTQSLIGYNIHGEVEADSQRSTPRAKLYAHLDKVQSRLHLVIRNIDLAIDLAKRYPKSTILIRYWPDGAVHLPGGEYKSPLAWIAMVEKDWQKCKAAGAQNVAFCTTNEPGSFVPLVEWHTRRDGNGNDQPAKPKGVMDYAAERGIPLSVLHLAIGAVQPNEFELFRPVLHMCAKHDHLFALAIHEYFTALPSSGMPHLDKVTNKPYFEVAPGNWPKAPEETRWHVGRHQFLLDVCDKHGIPRPRLHVTEAGADRLDEGGGGWVAQWLNSLKVTPGYLNIRGWRSCQAQWKEWFPQWKPEQAYLEMMRYLVEFVWGAPYKGKPRRVEGVCMFSWWNSGVLGTEFDWSQFRVDNANEFLAEHEKWMAEGTTIPEPPKPDPESEPPTQPDTITISKLEHDRLKAIEAQYMALLGTMVRHGAAARQIEKAAIQQEEWLKAQSEIIQTIRKEVGQLLSANVNGDKEQVA